MFLETNSIKEFCNHKNCFLLVLQIKCNLVQSFPDPNAKEEVVPITFGRRKDSTSSKIKKAAHNKTAEAVKGWEILIF